MSTQISPSDRIRKALKNLPETLAEAHIAAIQPRQLPSKCLWGCRLLEALTLDDLMNLPWQPFEDPHVKPPTAAFATPIECESNRIRLRDLLKSEPHVREIKIVLRPVEVEMGSHLQIVARPFALGAPWKKCSRLIVVLGSTSAEADEEYFLFFCAGEYGAPARPSPKGPYLDKTISLQEAVSFGFNWAEIEPDELA